MFKINGIEVDIECIVEGGESILWDIKSKDGDIGFVGEFGIHFERAITSFGKTVIESEIRNRERNEKEQYNKLKKSFILHSCQTCFHYISKVEEPCPILVAAMNVNVLFTSNNFICFHHDKVKD